MHESHECHQITNSPNRGTRSAGSIATIVSLNAVRLYLYIHIYIKKLTIILKYY